MRLLILIFLSIPITMLAQKEESFAKFINEDGSLIKGSSVTKLFERQIPLYSLETNSASNSTIIRLTIGTESAAGIINNLMLTNKKMRSGEITVTFLNTDRRLVQYKINIENIAVEEYSSTNGISTIQLHASRIGWTYYSNSRSGVQSISSKTGWDEDKRKAWTNF